MNGARDDFIDALNYKVKEEVIKNYLRERRILEEEIREYGWNLDEYRAIERETAERRGDLACLLVTPQYFDDFFLRLGFSQTPFSWLGFGPRFGGPPACPVGLTPRGFTARGRYMNLTVQTYALFGEKVGQGRESADGLRALAEEINNDIKKFHQNHDLMSIIGFLRSMDTEMRLKKRILGSNFTADEVGELENSLMFRFLDPQKDGVRDWPKLPGPREAETKTADLLKDIFRRERACILPAVGKSNRKGGGEQP